MSLIYEKWNGLTRTLIREFSIRMEKEVDLLDINCLITCKIPSTEDI
jgi:hypothetical protein